MVEIISMAFMMDAVQGNIGNMNAVSYKEIIPLIKDNLTWLGNGFSAGNALFGIPETATKEYVDGVYDPTTKLVKFRNCCWYTNIDHGRRHEPLPLMTMEDNILYSKHKEIRVKGYTHYENFDAIDVPFVDAIPIDYEGMMGVPRSFLDKFCPDQFEIVGNAEGDSGKDLGLKPYPRELRKQNKSLRDGQPYYFDEEGIPQKPFGRIIIRKKRLP